MVTTKKFRYPGINSFETTDTDIFFGREDDRVNLADLVEIEKSVLLYSRSGLGKSSLLKAALIPELVNRGYQPYYIRFGLYQEDNLSPVQSVLRKTVMIEGRSLPSTFLQKFISRTTSLWYVFKAQQIARLQNEETKEDQIVLIFDQFEEISSYSNDQLLEFKQQLAELVYTPIPKNYLEALKDDDLLTEQLTDAELDVLYKHLRVKVVFAIRSDQMSILNKFSDHLPNILKVFYELKTLSQKQALQAIVQPAKKEGEFVTPVFEYKPEALEKIVKVLSSKKHTGIDTAQLQILLQYIEQEILLKAEDAEISAHDLGDLNKVYENYYNSCLNKLKTEREQSQILIEDKLIADDRRVSYDKALCLQLVNENTLKNLVETRLLRQEPNSMGGYSYEISHDSLIAPMLQAKEKRHRLEEEARRKVQYEAQLTEQRKKQYQQRLILSIVSIATIVSTCLGIWAFTEQMKTTESLEQVKIQKDSTQKALDDFITVEIARKSIEKEQLLTAIRTYSNSNDSSLKNEAVLSVDTLENQIRELKNKLSK